MMISGYEAGTEVRWNDDNSPQAGIIERVFHRDATIELENQQIHIVVRSNAPVYLVRQQAGGNYRILPHRDVIIANANPDV